MTGRRLPTLLLVLHLLGSTAPALAGNSIRIEDDMQSCWSRFSNRETLYLTKRGYASKKRTVSSKAVDAARQACIESADCGQNPSPELFGITASQIRLHEAEAIAAAAYVSNKSAQQLPKTITYQDVSRAVEIALCMGSSRSTTRVSVKVTFDQKPPLVASSTSTISTMVPWSIRLGDKTWKTCSLAVSQKLSKVLRKSNRSNSALAGNVDYWSKGFWNDVLVWHNVFRHKNAQTNQSTNM
jgi:hypothetical protein